MRKTMKLALLAGMLSLAACTSSGRLRPEVEMGLALSKAFCTAYLATPRAPGDGPARACRVYLGLEPAIREAVEPAGSPPPAPQS